MHDGGERSEREEVREREKLRYWWTGELVGHKESLTGLAAPEAEKKHFK